MYKLELGSIVKEFINYQEGVKFQFDDSGSELVIFFNKPTLGEINDIKSGKLQFGLFVKDEIIFILSKFGNMPWMDSPFHVALAPSLTTLQEVAEGQGYGCNIILVDSSNGEIKALRYISFNTRFSRKLKKNIEEQKSEIFNNHEYGLKLSRIMSYYSTNDMVKYAEVSCRVK